MKLIPEGALNQHIAVLGKTGAGKSYAAKGAIVEPLLEKKRRVGIVDPTDAWHGLRSSRDGNSPGFPVLVLGGDHGDLPLPANGGAAVARLLVEQGVNLVASTKHLTVGERTRWFIDFAGTVSRLNRAPLHLVLDEAHNFAPQGKVPDPDTGRMLHAANTLASGGRSIGVRLVMITQRPQKLHKDALTSADTLIAMRVLAPHDRLAVEDWIKGCGDPAQGKEVLNSLAGLKRGEGWVWYPEGAHLIRARFPEIKTFDSSATPHEGHEIAAPKASAEVDLTEIRAALADAVKEAEANDPKLLRAEIARLKGEIAKKSNSASSDLQEIKDGEQRGYELGQADALRGMKEVADALGEMAESVSLVSTKMEAVQLRLYDRAKSPPALARQRATATPVAVTAKVETRYEAEPPSAVGSAKQRILDALAWLEAVHIERAEKVQLALLADQSPKSSGYTNNLGALRSAGLIDYPQPGQVALTSSGRRAANAPARPPTTDDLHRTLEGRLPTPQWLILKALISYYPEAVAKSALAAEARQSATSSGYTNNLGTLRSLGFIDYPAPGEVAALPVLFLDR